MPLNLFSNTINTHICAGWHSSTMNASTIRRSTCRSRRSSQRERATAISSSSSRSLTSFSMWVFQLSLINDVINIILFAGQTGKSLSFLLRQLSFVFAELPMAFVLNSTYLHDNSHVLAQVKHCGKETCLLTSSSDSVQIHHNKLGTIKVKFTSMLILRGRVWEIGMFINFSTKSIIIPKKENNLSCYLWGCHLKPVNLCTGNFFYL